MKDRNICSLYLLPEESTDRLSMVHAANGFGEHRTNFKDFQLGAQATVFILRNAVRYDDLVQSGSIDTRNGISTEYAVSEQSVNVGCSLLFQQLGRPCNCVRRIRQIVDQDSNSVGNLSNQHHGGVLAIGNAGGSTFLGDMSVRKFRERGSFYLVDQCEFHVQVVRNCRCSLRSTCIRTDNDSILEIRDVLLDVSLDERLAIQIINRDVEEALILRVVQVHCNYVVCPSAGEKICNERSGLCDPLFVTWLCLEVASSLVGDNAWIFVVVSREGRRSVL